MAFACACAVLSANGYDVAATLAVAGLHRAPQELR